MSSKKFPSKKKFWQMALVLSCLAGLVIALVLICLEDSISTSIKTGVSVFMSFFLFILFFSILYLFVSYSVSEKGIILQSLFHKELIAFDSLKECRLLSKEEAQTLWHSIMSDGLQKRIEARHTGDTSGYLSLGKKQKYLTRFCTIMPSSLIKGYEDTTVISHKTYISGQFLLLTEYSGRQFIITPREAEAMLAEVKKYRNAGV